MSTKIHNGFRLAAGTDPFDFTTSWREALRPVRMMAEGRAVLEEAVKTIAQADVLGEPRTDNVLASASADYIFSAMDAKRERPRDFGTDPFRFEVTLGKHVDSGRILGIYYAEEKSLVDTFKALPEFEDYSYWDNSDRPKEIGEEEWDERDSAWGDILHYGDTPADVMLSAVLDSQPASILKVTDFTEGELAPLLDEVLSDSCRRAKISLYKVMDQVVAAHAEATGDRHSIFSILTSPDGPRPNAGEVDALAAVLTPLTEEDFLRDESVTLPLSKESMEMVAAYRERAEESMRKYAEEN